MMERERLVRELLYQIRLGEDSRYEFKQVTFKGNKLDGPEQKNLAIELAALANSKGGCLLLGVDDKTREVLGIPLDKMELVLQRINAACQDSIAPPLTVYSRTIELPDRQGNQHAVIYIQIDKSLFVHTANGRYYHRSNESAREMKPDYLARLMMQRSQARMIWFDEQAVPRTTEADIDPALSQRFLRGDQPAALQLRKLKLLVENEDQQTQLSVAGVLMATTQPEQWLPSAYIQAVCYKGMQRDANDQLDAQDITGPLDQQVIKALAFVERNMKTAATKTIGRKDIPQYSLKAIFEALVNAVAHRDYAIHGGNIRLHMFADCLVLASPGALVNTLEVDDLELRQATRNQLIATLLARSTVSHQQIERAMMMDKRGEGVPLIVYESEALGARRPEYQLVGEELQLTIYAADVLASAGY